MWSPSNMSMMKTPPRCTIGRMISNTLVAAASSRLEIRHAQGKEHNVCFAVRGNVWSQLCISCSGITARCDGGSLRVHYSHTSRKTRSPAPPAEREGSHLLQHSTSSLPRKSIFPSPLHDVDIPRTTMLPWPLHDVEVAMPCSIHTHPFVPWTTILPCPPQDVEGAIPCNTRTRPFIPGTAILPCPLHDVEVAMPCSTRIRQFIPIPTVLTSPLQDVQLSALRCRIADRKCTLQLPVAQLQDTLQDIQVSVSLFCFDFCGSCEGTPRYRHVFCLHKFKIKSDHKTKKHKVQSVLVRCSLLSFPYERRYRESLPTTNVSSCFRFYFLD